MEQSVRVITIDGPAASGKGTVAERIAHELGFHYLDSGALYRLATYRALKLGTPLDDAEALERVASSMAPVFEQGRILLDGEDVTLRIRTEEVSRATSRVAAVPGVRKALFDLQRRAAKAQRAESRNTASAPEMSKSTPPTLRSRAQAAITPLGALRHTRHTRSKQPMMPTMLRRQISAQRSPTRLPSA